jgi:hypothetical protein
VTVSVDGYEYASWGLYAGGEIFEQRWNWFNGVHLYRELPITEISGNYTLQVFATQVPGPATWTMLLIGFGRNPETLARHRRSLGAI